MAGNSSSRSPPSPRSVLIFSSTSAQHIHHHPPKTHRWREHGRLLDLRNVRRTAGARATHVGDGRLSVNFTPNRKYAREMKTIAHNTVTVHSSRCHKNTVTHPHAERGKGRTIQTTTAAVYINRHRMQCRWTEKTHQTNALAAFTPVYDPRRPQRSDHIFANKPFPVIYRDRWSRAHVYLLYILQLPDLSPRKFVQIYFHSYLNNIRSYIEYNRFVFSAVSFVYCNIVSYMYIM